MPELPEVQTIVNDLKKEIIGKKIVDFKSDFKKSIKSISFDKKIKNKKIISVERLGKNILIKLEDNLNILIHLKMTGKLLLKKKFQKKKRALDDKHTHSVFFLKNNMRLEFSDIRKFGTITLLSEAEVLDKISKNGVDPFNNNFTINNLISVFKKNRSKSIKAVLMDQSCISGIGNIYASEILFDAKIKPQRKSSNLSVKEIQAVFKSTLKILKKALLLRGTSVSDYRDSDNKKGKFQNYLMVYKRNGQKCKICATIVEKLVIEQRSTFYCPKCQR